jgi:citrate synthase
MAEAPAGGKVRTIADVMSRPAVTAQAAELVTEAATRMEERRVGSVVVVDGNRPVGILTERDMIRVASSGTDLATAKVGEWMTPQPDTITPDVEVSEAWRSFSERGYRHIPVVNGTELVGIVTMRDLMRVSQLQPMPGAAIDVPQGLKGVVVTETEVGDVRGYEGFYHYRQYSAIDLAEQRPLEDVWHLMFEGELPRTEAEREAFRAEVAPLRVIPEGVRPLLPAIAAASESPLDGLRTAVSLIAAASGFKPNIDIDRTELRANAMQICAVVPTILTALHRIREGQEPVEPHPSLGYAANYLYMMTGSEPDPKRARAIEQYLISTVDHGFNASTFTARVVTSTGADLGAAVTAAIGALSGPWHGGAPSRALDTLDAIGTPDNVDDWVRPRIEAGEKMMGFGHPVYRTHDPRSLMLRGIAESIGGDIVDFAKKVETRIVEILNEVKPGREIYTNVEFYAGVVMELSGLPRSMFTPTFASSRVIGWCANILEQAAHNKIIRPAARYVGPPPPQPVPPLEGS